MIETDDFEKKLERFRERNQVEISDAFLEKLMALEPRPAAKKPRRRYVLPIAAAAALALALGGWLAWQHTAAPEPAQTPVAIQSGSSNAAVETPPEPSKPEETPQPGTKEPRPQEEQVPEESVTLTGPVASPKSDSATPAETDETTPETPDGTKSSKPEDMPSAKPENTEPAMPDGADPQGSEDADLPDPAATDEDQTIVSMERPQIGISCRTEGGRETLTLTLLSTGESVNIDVTGFVPPNPAPSDQEGSPSEPDGAAASQAGANHLYWGSCSAFGWQIMYVLVRNSDNTISSQIVDMRQN